MPESVLKHSFAEETNWLKSEVGRHAFHPMSAPMDTVSNPPPIIVRGEGVYVTDLDGRKMIDCQGGLWCVNAGYGRSEIIDAVNGQMHELPYYNIFPGAANAPAVKLAARLCEVSSNENMGRVLFGSGGSDATETAFKIARQYWKLKGEPERLKYISLRGGYHGLHFGGMSACGGDAWRRNYEPLVPGFLNVESPNIYRPPFEGVDEETLATMCASLLEREILFQGPDTVAALIAEPVQGAGGVNVPPANYWPKLREICDRYKILLIADEVITGFGRSGELFGVQNWGVKPDIMCLAKGITSGYIPLGATLISEELASAWEAEGPRSVVMHGYTYSGHPVACAAGLAAVDIAIKEDLAANAKSVGAYFLSQLRKLMDRHEVIGDVRGKGLMIAVELVKDRKSKEAFGADENYPISVSDLCLDNGVLLRTIANKFIISPPLIFTKEHCDQVVSTLDYALERTPR